MPLEPLPDGICPPDYRLIPAGMHDARARAFLAAIWQILCLPFDKINTNDIDNQDITVIRHLLNQWDLERFIEPFMTDEDLRELARKGLLLHRLSGTKRGIELALSIADVEGQLKEWWEFSTSVEVHTFEVIVWVDQNLEKGRDFNDPTIIENLRRLIIAAKPVRSFFDVIVSKLEPEKAIAYANAAISSAQWFIQPTPAAQESNTFETPVYSGAAFASANYNYNFTVAKQ